MSNDQLQFPMNNAQFGSIEIWYLVSIGVAYWIFAYFVHWLFLLFLYWKKFA